MDTNFTDFNTETIYNIQYIILYTLYLLRKQLQMQHQTNPEEVEKMKNNYREEWITAIAEESLLTRSRHSFLIKIWDVLYKIDNSITMREAEFHNRALCDMLTTDYGQNMLEQYPGLTTMLKTEIYYQYVKGEIEFWEECWDYVFEGSIQ